MPSVRLVLASAPHADTFGYSMPPPGLLRLGGACRRAGFDVALDDFAFRLARGELGVGDAIFDACAERILRGGAPDVVGLSTMGATLPAALAIAERVCARAPDAFVVLGGPGVGGLDAALVERFPAVDAVVRGEGEETLVELLGARARGSRPAGVRGVTWRDAGGLVVREPDRTPLRDLAELPPYAWDLLPPLAAYKAITGEDEGLVPVDSGRGCVYDCSFCSIGRFWSRRSRPLPVARLVDEVAAVAAIEGGRSAYLCHDLFGADRRHALAFCTAMIERGVGVPWEARARVDHLDDELVGAMARAGCYRVLLGIETGDGEVRNAHGKQMRAELDVVAAVERLVRAGIVPILSFLLGLPGEDDAALARTLAVAARAALVGGVNLSLHLPNPQPGCELGERYGESSRPVEAIPPDMAWGAGTSATERAYLAAHPDLFTTWSLLTSLPGGEPRLRALADLARTVPELLTRYPRAFAVLAARRGEDALALARAWLASELGFEGFALRARDRWVDAALRWDRAVLRAGARGPGGAAAPQPRLAAELVELERDVVAAVAALRDGCRPAWDASAAPHVLAVLATGRGTRTLRTTTDAATLLRALDGTTPPAALGLESDAGRAALERWTVAGLVRAAASPAAVPAAVHTQSPRRT